VIWRIAVIAGLREFFAALTAYDGRPSLRCGDGWPQLKFLPVPQRKSTALQPPQRRLLRRRSEPVPPDIGRIACSKYNENRGIRHKTAMTAGPNYFLCQSLTRQIRYPADQWNFSRRSTNFAPLTTE
jgi:hypothetical protein